MTWIERFKYLDAHKHKAGWFLAVLFCWLWVNHKCAVPVVAPAVVAEQKQEIKYVDRWKTVTRVIPGETVYVPGEAPRPLPCPQVIVETEGGSEAVHWQSQSLTQTPKIVPQTVNSAIFLGGGYLDGPILAGGYRRDILTLQAIGWTDKIGGLVTVDLIRFP